MRNQLKTKRFSYLFYFFGILIVLTFTFYLNENHVNYSDDRLEEITHTDENAKKSGPLGYNIHVDNNWTQTRAMYAWCTGSGTFSDPFIIQDVEIDANGGIGILIENNLIENIDKEFFFKQKGLSISTGNEPILDLKINNNLILHNDTTTSGIMSMSADNPSQQFTIEKVNHD